MTAQLMDKVQAVNRLLLEDEPENISYDSYANYTGYKPQYIVDAMNAVFGIGAWGFEELSNEIKDGSALAIAQVRVFLKDITTQPTGWGQARVTKGDVGDAHKGAQTDALKKALSYFSIGNRAYQGLLPVPEEKQSRSPQTGRPSSGTTATMRPAAPSGATQQNGHQQAQQGQQTARVVQNGHAPVREEKPAGAPVKPPTVAAVVAAPTPVPPTKAGAAPISPTALQEEVLAELTSAGVGSYELAVFCTFANVSSTANHQGWSEADCTRLHDLLPTWMELDRGELGHKAWVERLVETDEMHKELERLNGEYKVAYGAIQGAGGLAQYLRHEWGYEDKRTFKSLPRAVIDQMLATMRAAVAKGPFHPDAFQVPAAYQGLVKANRETVVVP